MLRTSFLIFALGLGIFVNAQQDALATLTGVVAQQWKVISTPPNQMQPWRATYTFSAKEVVVKECAEGAWKSTKEVLETWGAGGKSGIAFAGARYEVKSLPAAAAACKGNANCVRLTTVPDGKTDATRSIYLAH